MRIAYISYEHPQGRAGGGIGTYVHQVAKLMVEEGHLVEVFASHTTHSDRRQFDGYKLNLVAASSMEAFREKVAQVFAAAQLQQPFDVIEAPEYGADALFIKEQFPRLPLVVKLHTPGFLTARLNQEKVELSAKLRYYAGGIIRGKLPKAYWRYRKEEDPEYEQYQLADGVCSPSASLIPIVKKTWPTHKEIVVLPNPFVPPPAFLSLPSASYSGAGPLVISFIGRLEKRKGILNLMHAIPLVLKTNPHVVFQFVGQPHPSPKAGVLMDEYLKAQLAPWITSLRFLGFQSYDQLPKILAGTHACVFPSAWENFPNVCLEAMAAGRAVVASKNGGMAEMIRHEQEGILIDPDNADAIAAGILRLAAEELLVERLGKAARDRVLNQYTASVLANDISTYYRKVAHWAIPRLSSNK